MSRHVVTILLALSLAACAAEAPGVFRADGSAAYLGPKSAVVLDSRQVEVEDPYGNQNHTAAAYGGAVLGNVVGDSVSNDGAIVALATLAGMGFGWMMGELSEESLPGHAYVVKDTASGDVYTVVQPMRVNDWLLPPGTEVVVVGESRAARVVPETDETWLWEGSDPDPGEPESGGPTEVWREPAPRWEEPAP